MESLESKLKEKQLITSLNKCCKRLDKEYNINSGGCIYTAYIIAKYLVKNNINYKVKIYYDYNDEPFHFVLIINNHEINPEKHEDLRKKKEVDYMSPTEIAKYNKEHEDDLSYWWKQKYKKNVREEIYKVFNKLNLVDTYK